MRSSSLLRPAILGMAALATPHTDLPTFAAEKSSDARFDEVARLSSEVMSFDLDRTIHVFTPTPSGGIQQVLTKEADDTCQIDLVRSHLMDVAKAFRAGEFSAPESIHGADMPGLDRLKEATPGQMQVEYRELPKGAQIKHATAKPCRATSTATISCTDL
ncbi:MAG: aspartate carbamoyltransferase [Methylococcaceae bacterium]|nr:aspartate carbamoyltransferase [Methylococcaceae bacterium]